MKTSIAILVLALVLGSAGCGADDPATTSGAANTSANGVEQEEPLRPPPVSDRDDPRFATVSSGGRRADLRIEPSDRPPPKRLLLRDIEVGAGPAVRPGDRVTVFYVGVDYDTGKRVIETWPPEAALTKEIRREEPVAWEEGVVGMRVGGRREMLIPAHRALGTGALDYVFDLVGVEPGSKARPGS